MGIVILFVLIFFFPLASILIFTPIGLFLLIFAVVVGVGVMIETQKEKKLLASMTPEQRRQRAAALKRIREEIYGPDKKR